MTDPRPAVRTLARLARMLEHACDAGRLALAKPTVSAAVDGLVERGLLVRAAIAEDRRAVRLKVTPEGRKVLARTERVMAERLGPVLDRAADPDAIVAALTDLAGALDEVMADRIGRPAGAGK